MAEEKTAKKSARRRKATLMFNVPIGRVDMATGKGTLVSVSENSRLVERQNYER